MNDVIKLLKYESNEMNEEFNKASIKGNAIGNYLAYNIKPKRWGYISYSDVEKM